MCLLLICVSSSWTKSIDTNFTRFFDSITKGSKNYIIIVKIGLNYVAQGVLFKMRTHPLQCLNLLNFKVLVVLDQIIINLALLFFVYNFGVNCGQKSKKSKNLSEEKVAECCICLERLVGCDVIRLKCHKNHVFHDLCITKWMVDHNECPICRKQLQTWFKIETFYA